jgi:hypothetical protein
LALRERDKEFFQNFVQREDGFSKLIELPEPSSNSQKNLWQNARLFNDRLEQIEEGERIRLAQFVVTRCFLVAVSTPDLDSAYRIFSVLNSRGLDLSATDILKAEIIGALRDDLRDAYTKRWEDTEDDLGREGFMELFSHIRMVRRKAKPQGTLLKEFRDHVLNQISSAKFIDEVLIPYADVYEQLTDNAYISKSNAEVVNERLKWLNRLEFNDWIPPALAFSTRSLGKSDRMVAFFSDLERLSYFMLLTRSGINERIERFSRLTDYVEKELDLHNIESPLQLSPAEQYEFYEVLAGPVYDSLAARARSTLLLRIDALLSGGGATYDYNVVTVEHVLPQNPESGSDWFKWFPDQAARLGWVHKLGNLALLTRKKNSSASNYSFERKKTSYFARDGISPFVITTQVLEHSTWTPAIVEARQKSILVRLEDHWKLKDRKDPITALLE